MNNAVVRNAYTVYIHENTQSLPSLSGPGLEDSEGLQNREREREREGFRMKAGVVNMLPVSREKSDFRDLDLVIQPQLVAHTQK